MPIGMIQVVLLSWRATSIATEPAVYKPPMMVTNVVGRRVVRDVVQMLFAVTPANESVGERAPVGLPEASPAGGPGSNTFWAEIVKQARAGGFTLDTNMESRFQGVAAANDPRRVVPPEATRSPTTLWAYRWTLPHVVINKFAGFVPGSLASVVLAGFHTNGRTMRVWDYPQVPSTWPTNPPVLWWNTNNLMWGRKGITAISPVAQGIGAFGQGEITLLTRRHGYVRGHGMGLDGLDPTRVGRRAWFYTRDNQPVECRVKLLVIRTQTKDRPGDYSIVLFDADLPPDIEPMRVVDLEVARRKYLHFLGYEDDCYRLRFMSLQEGYVSTELPYWEVPVRGGDSGNPVMLPLPNELLFLNGMTTSPPSATMQADMDMLSRKAGLDPRKYQMQWVNLDQYPDY
jgi:hypothetical protein